ncbi:MAG TPA: BMP family ABC transporter substrate-binding protein [Symbiobacteriaceae bacterium]|nr:BMP family ABC transporter substrate-binding protein [Symbiobacteriaceae bacterium]
MGGVLLDHKEPVSDRLSTYEGQLKPENLASQLRDAAQKHDLVFVMGFEGIDAMMKAADAYPKAQFVSIDAPIDHPKIASVVYRDEEGCFLAGALAGLMTVHTSLSGMGWIGLLILLSAVFGGAESLSLRLQQSGVPAHFPLMLPYVATLLLLALNAFRDHRKRMPMAPERHHNALQAGRSLAGREISRNISTVKEDSNI